MTTQAKLNYSVYLIKESIESFDEIVYEDKYQFVEDINQKYGLNGKLFIGHNNEIEPDWFKQIKTGINSSNVITNQSTRAVLLLKRKNRFIAFTFGHGKHMIKIDAYERGFGLKMVLNNCEVEKLKSIDAATVDTVTVQARTQTSKSSTLPTFNIDNYRDFLQAIKAEAKDYDRYGKILSGRDGFNFTSTFSFESLKQLCDQLLEDYHSNKYKHHFDWIDHLTQVKDPATIEHLDTDLIEQINNNKEGDTIHLAAPEIMGIDTHDLYSYNINTGGTYNELNIKDYFNEKRPRHSYTINKLKKDKIYVIDENKQELNKWSIYNCLITELEYNGNQYVLTLGNWFQVDNSYMNEINQYIDEIENCPIVLPDYKSSIHSSETEYNADVPDTIENEVINMDKVNIYVDNGKFEFCDLLSKEGHIIHVKPWKSSATLSHLFSQGRISAESISNIAETRGEIKEQIQKIDPTFSELIDPNNFINNNFTVVFAIIYAGDKTIHERIPFFSKLNFVHNVKSIRSMQFRVQKLHINKF